MQNNSLKPHIKPTSPHLTIYKPQITSVLSILHRISGVVFLIGLLIFCWFMILQSYNVIDADLSQDIFYNMHNNPLLIAPILLWLYSLLYHLCNGLRYFFWGFGRGFDMKTVTISGTAAIIASLFLLFLFYFITSTI
jgi:succinate dehydrogenase / fumarate reductase cytochrome b subunit